MEKARDLACWKAYRGMESEKMDEKALRRSIEACRLSEPPLEDARSKSELLALLGRLVRRLVELGLQEQDEGKAMRYFAAAKLIKFVMEELKEGKLF